MAVRNLPLLIAVLLIGILATLGILASIGKIGPGASKNGKNGNGADKQPPGTVMVVIPRTPIPAYTKVGREHLYDRAGNVTFVYVGENSVQPGTLKTTSDVLGRVLSRDKPAGMAFHENDFMPEGTRPGSVAGIPPGRRSVVVKASRIDGAYALNIGDHFDLVSLVRDQELFIGTDGQLIASPNSERRRSAERTMRPILLARDAVVVRQVTARQEFYEHRGGLVGARVDIRTKPVEEITFAVKPEETGEIVEALGGNAIIVALARSGQVGDFFEEIPDYESPISQYLKGQEALGAGGSAIAKGDGAEDGAPIVRQIVIEAIVGQDKKQVVFLDKSSPERVAVP